MALYVHGLNLRLWWQCISRECCKLIEIGSVCAYRANFLPCEQKQFKIFWVIIAHQIPNHHYLFLGSPEPPPFTKQRRKRDKLWGAMASLRKHLPQEKVSSDSLRSFYTIAKDADTEYELLKKIIATLKWPKLPKWSTNYHWLCNMGLDNPDR